MGFVDAQYGYVERVARERGLVQTLAVLPYVCEKHEGMYRRGPERLPYVAHPLTMAHHAIALGWIEDDLLAACLLHDVCEDCDVAVEDLPVGDCVKHSVALLTKKDGFSKDRDNPSYYAAIAEDRIASLVKILDRCNNVCAMPGVFPEKKMVRYMKETIAHLYPLMDSTMERFPDTADQIFLLRYHIMSVLHAIESLCTQG